MSTRTRSSLITIVAVFAIPLLTGAKGPGCGGEVSLGDDKTECPASSCGALPAIACADGTSPFTGKCLSKTDGTCAWETRTCGSTSTPCTTCTIGKDVCSDGKSPYTGKCYADSAGACVAEYTGCGTPSTSCEPCGIPAIACADGTSPYTGKCVKDAKGVCTAEYKGCGGTTTCEPCVIPDIACADGSIPYTGKCFKDASTGACTAEYKGCPTSGSGCTDKECGPMPPVAACPGGKGPDVTCNRKADGTCHWDVSTCPETSCTYVESLPRKCASKADCTFGLHQINCCGSKHAMGYNIGSAAAFADAEKACDATYPACGCAEGPTVDDSGKAGLDFAVDCVSGACTTYVTKSL